MDIKVLIDADFVYATNTKNGFVVIGKELLENERMMNKYIKSFESTATVKKVHYFVSSDGKRHFSSKSAAIQYELLCYTCSKIINEQRLLN